MTELKEAVKLANIADKKKDLKCPFCYDKPLGHDESGDTTVSDQVESKPSKLECDNADSWKEGVTNAKRKEGNDLHYTVAQHHLISANQCYAKVKRLVRMGNLAKYDINCKENGIGLPTTHYNLKYPKVGEGNVPYGALDDTGPKGVQTKETVANSLMAELGAQWHVGHHAFAIKTPKVDPDTWEDEGMDEKDNEDYPHETSYDQEVLSRIFNLCKSFPANFCEDPEKDEKFKEDMNDISKEIKDKLEKFNGESQAKPAESYPFFVSQKAYEFAGSPTYNPQDKNSTDNLKQEKGRE